MRALRSHPGNFSQVPYHNVISGNQQRSHIVATGMIHSMKIPIPGAGAAGLSVAADDVQLPPTLLHPIYLLQNITPHGRKTGIGFLTGAGVTP
jgi:hypothetical protein